MKTIEIQSSGTKRYKNVMYFRKNDLKDKHVHIAGMTCLSEISENDKNADKLYVFYTDKNYKLKDKIYGKTIGYLKCSNSDEYIVLKRRYPFILLFLFILMIGSVYAVSYPYKDDIPINTTGNDNITNIVSVEDSQDMRIVINSYIECDTNGTMKNMGIKNLNEERYLRYIFYNQEKEIYDSQLIENKRTIHEDRLIEKIKKGKYTIKCKVESYNLNKKLMGYHFVEITLEVK